MNKNYWPLKPLLYQLPKPLMEEKGILLDMLTEIQQKRDELQMAARNEVENISLIKIEVAHQKEEIQQLLHQLEEAKKQVMEYRKGVGDCPFCHKHDASLLIKEDHFND